MINVLRSFPNSSDIENAVKSLDMDLVDVLMKYLYKGFEKEPRYSNVFLNWHDKVKLSYFQLIHFIFYPLNNSQAFAVGGNGSIVRVLSDRKRV